MISHDLAEQLHRAGVRWAPQPGDRFAVRSSELAGEVFTVADMVVEAREYPSGTLLAFNGTTEWALDSVQLDEVLWLPLEHQVRDLLGRAFGELVGTNAGYQVRVRIPGHPGSTTFTAAEAVDAYALALLALVDAVGS